jgi:SNW domain-containing protein 1
MLASMLPQPRHVSSVGSSEDTGDSNPSSSSLIPVGPSIPSYGKRVGWKPKRQEEFANGGAYPECHIAQYPLEMGRKKTGKSGSALALQVDADGNVRYDAIVHQGRREGQHVQSQFKDMVPLRERGDDKDASRDMERPSEDDVAATAERTRLALERITQGKIKSAQTKNVAITGGDSKYIRYTPGHQQGNDGTKQRIIKMTEQAEDPLAPPRWKMKKVPAGPPSPPAPVLRSPPRKVTAQEQKDWMIPPCISNWKNNKGFTIALDKRLAADGRGLQDVHINDGFAQFSEALNLADRHAREEVRQRSMMQQKLAAKEKAAKEDHLRQLAQRARDERSGISAHDASRLSEASTLGGGGGGLSAAMAGYSSDSDSDSDEDEDDEAAKDRDRVRQERKRERERDMRMSNIGTEQRAKMLAREENRDISEKVALGLAKKTDSTTQMDSRLFNQEKLSGTFGDDDSYSHFDKPLFAGKEAAAAMYRRPVGSGGADDIYSAENAEESMKNDRFGLGKSKAFGGAEYQEERSGPVQFEKDVSDPFAIDQFLDDAKRGTKRSGIEESSSSKRGRRDDE